MRENKNRVVNLRLTDSQKDILTQQAERENLTPSKLIRRALNKYLRKNLF